MIATETETTIERETIQRLSRDLRRAAATLSPAEVRYVVDIYYTLQKYRIRTNNQVKQILRDAAATPESAEKSERAACGESAASDERAEEENSAVVAEPHELLAYFLQSFGRLERQVPPTMRAWLESTRPGRWLLSIHGIGPVIGAGMLAHIDITKAATAGAIWRFAGLDPTQEWAPKQKRPWNARLKVLCWKLGESFCKLRGSEKDIYGKVYEARKALEIARNVNGGNAAAAAATLAKTPKHAQKDIYAAGLLPDGRIDLRAKRYAVKLFLSHLHHVLYVDHYGENPPKPYILTQPGHVHFVGPPNWPCE